LVITNTLVAPERDLLMDNSVNKSMTTPKPKLLDQVRAAIRVRHYSMRTEEAYIYWIKN
jgi:hypothetical protein